MAAGRLRFATSFGLVASLGLLAASLSGCAWQREYVRRGALLDSLASRAARVERAQAQQTEEDVRTRAEILTEIEALTDRLDQIDAQLADLGDRLDRVSRRVGAGHGDLTPRAESLPPVKAETLSPAPDTTGVGEDQLYNTAYLDFTRGKYDVAIGEFRQYRASYPSSDNADNAQYWVGECYYSLGQLGDAEKEFRAVLDAYPDGNKVPAAAYKLALVYLAQGRKNDARRQLQRVIDDYPLTNEAKLSGDRLRSLE